jgi:hypothetical protein
MAFPTTISTSIETYHGVAGPFVSSSGYVYVVTRGPTASTIQIFKATDPASSWFSAGNLAVTSGNTIRHINAYQLGDTLHIATRDAAAANSNVIRYHAFDMSTDAFTTSNELVKTTYTQKGTVDESMIGIVVRSAGAKIILYEGPQVLADVQRARTYYARHLGTAWTADFALDNGGNADWYPQEVVLGLANRVHFFLLDSTNNDLYQRTLTSANALETFPSAFDTSIASGQLDVGHQRAVAYSASAGGTVVRFPYFDDFGAGIADVQFTSADAPSPLSVTADITGTINPGGLRHVISLANDGATVYGGFVSSGNTIEFNNAAGTSTSVTANNFGLLLTATANSVLMVFIQAGSGNGTVSAVNVGATSLTRLHSLYYREGARRVELWGLTAAPTGTLTISAILANGELTNFGMAAVTYTGHRTSATPFGGIVDATASNTAACSLIISSTVGNKAVFGFMFDNTDAATVGSSLTKRLGVTTYLPSMIADVAGGLAVTGSAACNTAAWWGNIGINLIASATTRAIYLMSSEDAGSWSTPTIFQAGAISATWVNCFVRNSTRVLGIIYKENTTDLKYTEYTLSVGSTATIFAARLAMLGIGR